MSALRRLRVVVTAVASTLVLGWIVALVPASAQTHSVTVVPGVSLYGVACETSTACLAVGDAHHNDGAVVPVVDGMVGPVSTVEAGGGLYGIACPTSSMCIGLEWNPNGGEGKVLPIGLGGAGPAVAVGHIEEWEGISCPTATSCIAVAFAELSSTSFGPAVLSISINNGNVAVAAPILIDGQPTITDIACDTATTCLAVGRDELPSGQLEGTLVPIINGVPGTRTDSALIDYFGGVSCFGPGACLAVGAKATSDSATGFTDGELASVGFGGVTEVHTLPGVALSGVSCTPSGCVAVGTACTGGGCVIGCPAPGGECQGAIVQSSVTGSPSPTAVVPEAIGLDSVACTGSASCVAAGRTGSAAVITTISTGPPPAPGFRASPSSLTFANQRLGTVSPLATVSVTNTGGAPLTISHVAITGPNASSFAIATNTCTATLAPGASCTTGVNFKPTADAVRKAALTYTDNASGAPHSVPLSGRGCLILSASRCL